MWTQLHYRVKPDLMFFVGFDGRKISLGSSFPFPDSIAQKHGPQDPI